MAANSRQPMQPRDLTKLSRLDMEAALVELSSQWFASQSGHLNYTHRTHAGDPAHHVIFIKALASINGAIPTQLPLSPFDPKLLLRPHQANLDTNLTHPITHLNNAFQAIRSGANNIHEPYTFVMPIEGQGLTSQHMGVLVVELLPSEQTPNEPSMRIKFIDSAWPSAMGWRLKRHFKNIYPHAQFDIISTGKQAWLDWKTTGHHTLMNCYGALRAADRRWPLTSSTVLRHRKHATTGLPDQNDYPVEMAIRRFSLNSSTNTSWQQIRDRAFDETFNADQHMDNPTDYWTGATSPTTDQRWRAFMDFPTPRNAQTPLRRIVHGLMLPLTLLHHALRIVFDTAPRCIDLSLASSLDDIRRHSAPTSSLGIAALWALRLPIQIIHQVGIVALSPLHALQQFIHHPERSLKSVFNPLIKGCADAFHTVYNTKRYKEPGIKSATLFWRAIAEWLPNRSNHLVEKTLSQFDGIGIEGQYAEFEIYLRRYDSTEAMKTAMQRLFPDIHHQKLESYLDVLNATNKNEDDPIRSRLNQLKSAIPSRHPLRSALSFSGRILKTILLAIPISLLKLFSFLPLTLMNWFSTLNKQLYRHYRPAPSHDKPANQPLTQARQKPLPVLGMMLLGALALASRFLYEATRPTLQPDRYFPEVTQKFHSRWHGTKTFFTQKDCPPPAKDQPVKNFIRKAAACLLWFNGYIVRPLFSLTATATLCGGPLLFLLPVTLKTQLSITLAEHAKLFVKVTGTVGAQAAKFFGGNFVTAICVGAAAFVADVLSFARRGLRDGFSRRTTTMGERVAHFKESSPASPSAVLTLTNTRKRSLISRPDKNPTGHQQITGSCLEQPDSSSNQGTTLATLLTAQGVFPTAQGADSPTIINPLYPPPNTPYTLANG